MKMRVLWWAVGVTAALSVAALPMPAAERVVAVGDIHGAYEGFVSVLQTAGLVNKDLAWTGADAILIQTGDVLNRGQRSRDAQDLLMSLVEQARVHGGEVRPLLGNHETMVMSGDLRYVSPEEYKAFATPESQKTREREYKNYLKYRLRRSTRTGQPMPSGHAAEQLWMDEHPLGFFELRRAFAPTGKYGKWLRSLDTVTQVDDVMFLHGGISPDLEFKNVKEINQRMRKDLEAFDQMWSRLVDRGIIWEYQTLDEAQTEVKIDLRDQQASGKNPDPEMMTFLTMGNLLFASPIGPVWFRGYAQEEDPGYAPRLDHVLQQFKVKFMVLGHSIPAARRITPRFDGRVFLIDTGMLARSFQGRSSALEIAGGQFKSLYVGEPAQPLTARSIALEIPRPYELTRQPMPE